MKNIWIPLLVYAFFLHAMLENLKNQRFVHLLCFDPKIQNYYLMETNLSIQQTLFHPGSADSTLTGQFGSRLG